MALDPSLVATQPLIAHTANSVTQAGHPSSSDSIDGGRFVPGEILAKRYRVVGLMGRGGMGEVYRADDLMLGQSVALKFLPEALTGNESILASFHGEVRLARQIAHPNVCRVYDMGEADGRRFISMEFIRGEELASALRRFGRLPRDKASEIGRQVCAGVAAAHKQGVIHRDLKPANVMIDEEGDARVTDFGLAVVGGETSSEGIVGTIAYMSPEQLEGKELTTKSDIYSLGLVLYELFTGKRAFDSATAPDLLRLRRNNTQPSSPSAHVRDLDPVVERVIQRCLETDPKKRPSALEVAAALPGGDPLAAALAMGETPSPEMVAAAPKEGTLRFAVAFGCLASLLAGLAAVVLLSNYATLHGLVPLEKSPQVLRERAADILKELGYVDSPADDAYGFSHRPEYLQYLVEHDRSPGRWAGVADGRPPAVIFWYRTSPYYLVPFSVHPFVELDDPVGTLSGMSSLILDTQGRLTRFEMIPLQVTESPTTASEPDWRILFAQAGLDPGAFASTEPKWAPPSAGDVRRAWLGVYPGNLEIPIRVEAASFQGRPVYFQIVEPWTVLDRMRPAEPFRGKWAFEILFLFLALATMTVGVALAYSNLRSGLGDRKGALRLVIFVFSAHQLGWIIGFSHVPALEEFSALMLSVAVGLLLSGFMWLLYIALEPHLRRRWPHRIISWSRMLAGDWNDPLVGRDILVGGVAGAFGAALAYSSLVLPHYLGLSTPMPVASDFAKLSGLQRVIAMFLTHSIPTIILFGLGLMFLLLILYILLRREWLATIVLWLVIALMFASDSDGYFTALLFGALWAAVPVLIMARFGLLALASYLCFHHLCDAYPLTSNFSTWYAYVTLFVLAVTMLIALYSFRTSIGNQPILRGTLIPNGD